MHSNIKEYIENLRNKKFRLEKELDKVKCELQEIANAAKISEERSSVCSACNGTGDISDWHSGYLFECPDCNGTGYV